MSMRIFSVALLVALVACDANPVAKTEPTEAEAADRIECAVDGASGFSKDCSVERDAGVALTLRHAGGGFRRLTLQNDGTIDVADGAEDIIVQPLSDGRTEVVVGGDRYRLPATL